MKTKEIEKLLALAWAVALAPTPAEEQERVGELRQALHAADPSGTYQANAPTAGADEPDVSLRDSPRVSKLIGENEAGFHE